MAKAQIYLSLAQLEFSPGTLGGGSYLAGMLRESIPLITLLSSQGRNGSWLPQLHIQFLLKFSFLLFSGLYSGKSIYEHLCFKFMALSYCPFELVTNLD